MEETLSREIQRALRNNEPLSLLMIDIDHFKQFNDTFGHQAGDTLLRAEFRRISKPTDTRPGCRMPFWR